MKNIKKEIVINLQVEGLHRWNECTINEVIFLKNYHRHIFHIEIRKKVEHNDRHIEIIEFKRKVLKELNNKYFKENILFFDNMSCEDIAEWIYNKFQCTYVKVLEDNENGAIVC